MNMQGLLGFVYSAFRLAVERRYLRNTEVFIVIALDSCSLF